MKQPVRAILGVNVLVALLLFAGCSDDAAAPDAAADGSTDGAAKKDPCAAAPLTLEGGKAKVKGEVKKDEGGSAVSLDGTCTGRTTEGAEVFYVVTLQAKTYRVRLVNGSPMYDPSLYVFTDCKDPTGSCVAGADRNTTGHDEELTLTPTSETTYFIAIDSLHPAGETFSYGMFTLEIDAIEQPPNPCESPTHLTFTSDKATAKGDNATATNTVHLMSSHCTGKEAAGGEVFFSVDVTQGIPYKISLVPDSGFDPSLYVFTDCKNPSTTCIAGADKALTGGDEELVFHPAATGKVLIAVDSTYAVGASYSQGSFDLEVEKITPPKNDTCAAAEQLTISGGKLVKTGDTSSATSSVDLAQGDCTKNTTAGRDLFFKIDLKGGTKYDITLDGFAYDEALYLFTSCADVKGSCVLGVDKWPDIAEDLSITPQANGTYYLGIDGRGAKDHGPYTLTVLEQTLGSNDTCKKAHKMTFSGGVATAKGDTTMATNTVNLGPTGCVGVTTPGPDLFYSVQLVSGKAYTVTLTPGTSYEAALYVFESCNDPEGTCKPGWGSDKGGSGKPEVVTLTPSSTKTYLIAVDSGFGLGKGSFTLEVK